jgi:hypothetical protein
MSERRIEAVVLGPGPAGFLKVVFGRDSQQFVADVPAGRLPASLRLPNSEFVAVVDGRELVRVESEGQAWLEIQHRIRTVLNHDWDPIGIAKGFPDEYDAYIVGIFSLLRNHASTDAIAEHLMRIEVERMGLTGSARAKLAEVAIRLKRLQLPTVGDPRSAL